MERDWSTPNDKRDIFWLLEMEFVYKNTHYAANSAKTKQAQRYLDGWYDSLEKVCDYLRRSDIEVPDDFVWPDETS